MENILNDIVDDILGENPINPSHQNIKRLVNEHFQNSGNVDPGEMITEIMIRVGRRLNDNVKASADLGSAITNIDSSHRARRKTPIDIRSRIAGDDTPTPDDDK